MEVLKKIKLANIFRNIARYSLLVIVILAGIFALLTEAKDYGSVLGGVLKNSPNALPWLLLFLVVFLAWKKELIGGILIVLLGISMLLFFVINSSNFMWFPFILSLLIIDLGTCFILSWHFRK